MDTGYTFMSIQAPPTATQMARMCKSNWCLRAMAVIEDTIVSECTVTTKTADQYQLYMHIINPTKFVCDGYTVFPKTGVPVVTTATPVSSVFTDCPKELSVTAFEGSAVACEEASGYSFMNITARPTATQSTAICKDPACASVRKTIGSSVLSDCTIAYKTDLMKLYLEILNPISLVCQGGTTTTTPTTSNNTTTTPTSNKTPTPTVASTANDSSTAVGNPTANNTPTTNETPTPTPTSGTTTTGASSDASGSNTSLIVGVVVGVALVLAVLVFVGLRHRKKKQQQPTGKSLSPVFGNVDEYANEGAGHATTGGMYHQDRGGYTTAGSSSACTTNDTSSYASRSKLLLPDAVGGLWSDRAIQTARIPLENIQLGAELSRGAFGQVFRGSYDDQVVAIKKLLPARCKDTKEIQNFLKEAKLMTTLRHPCIVELVGVAWTTSSDLCIVSEFMDGGDLRGLLAQYDANHEPMGFTGDKIKIAVHVLHALAYLHSLEPSVMHRDLKSKNILLSQSLDAKLTDFGVSRERADTDMTVGVGSSFWMAPEVMVGGHYDVKADIFSFGVVLSELDTQQLPYAHATSGRQLPQLAICQQIAQGELKVAFSQGADPEIVELARACMALDPQDRPSANKVLQQLDDIWGYYGKPV